MGKRLGHYCGGDLLMSALQTFSGLPFYAEDMTKNRISIIDIAEALSKLCRYGGHCIDFYSVAEHSVLCYRYARERGFDTRIQRAALLHDASEAYLVDIPRPIKPHLPGYYDLEHEIMMAVAGVYDFSWPMPPEVKHIDNAICNDERAQNMRLSEHPDLHWPQEPALGIKLKLWSPREACSNFLAAFCEVR